jgi:hypothetical protein
VKYIFLIYFAVAQRNAGANVRPNRLERFGTTEGWPKRPGAGMRLVICLHFAGSLWLSAGGGTSLCRTINPTTFIAGLIISMRVPLQKERVRMKG